MVFRVAAVVLAAVTSVAVAQVPDNTTNVCVDPSSETNAKDGNYYDVCLDMAVFTDQKEKFNFNSAYVRGSTFSKVTFDNADFQYAFWEGTVFVDCVFKGTANFDQALMVDVFFKNCVFEDRPLFSQITIAQSRFEDTIFEDGVEFQQADFTDVQFLNSEFKGDETLFDNAAMRMVNMTSVVVDKWRWKFLDANEMRFHDVTVNEFNCHEPLDKDEYVVERAEFNSTTISSSTIKSMSCDQTVFRDTILTDLTLGDGTHDFSASNFTSLNIDTLGSDSGCAKLDFSHSIIGDGVVKNVDGVCEINFTNTTLGALDVSAIDVKDKKYVFKDAIFAGGRIAGECCVDVCKDINCYCDIKTEPTDGCPIGTWRTNPNAEKKMGLGCFPPSATVELSTGAHVPMSALAIGDHVLVAPGTYSPVFTFTHRTPHAPAVYVTLHTTSGHALTATPGHLIPASGALTPAGDVAPGATLTLASGATTTVVRTSASAGDGLYNPQTLHGDIVVDGVVASTYTTAVPAPLAHAALLPLRWAFSTLGLSTGLLEDGAPAYVLA